MTVGRTHDLFLTGHGVLCGSPEIAGIFNVPAMEPGGGEAVCCHCVTYINAMRPEQLHVSATAVAGSGRVIRSHSVVLAFPARDY